MKNILFLSFAIITSNSIFSQSKTLNLTYDQDLFSSIKYRLVGPFRGGRAGTAVGVNNNQNLYWTKFAALILVKNYATYGRI